MTVVSSANLITCLKSAFQVHLDYFISVSAVRVKSQKCENCISVQTFIELTVHESFFSFLTENILHYLVLSIPNQKHDTWLSPHVLFIYFLFLFLGLAAMSINLA